MKNILNFLREVGKLKGKERRGWLVHQIKNSETTAEHIFHLTFLVWATGKGKRINLDRAIKMALIHDLCEVYAPDLTPADALLFKTRKEPTLGEILKSRPKISYPTIGQRKKLAKFKKALERKAIKKLIIKLPVNLKKEIKDLWEEYDKELTNDAKFVKQAEFLANFLQAMEYRKKHKQIPHRLWVRWAKEGIDDPVLLKFIKEIEKNFCPEH